IVGDVAQTASAAGTTWWPEALDPVFGEHWNLRELTVSYRIPAAVAEAAQAFAIAAGLPVSELSAARDVPDAVRVTRTDDVAAGAATIAAAHAARFEESGGGECAIIAPADFHDEIRQALGAASTTTVLSA